MKSSLQIRKKMRVARNSLSQHQQQLAAKQVAEIAFSEIQQKQLSHIALYLANDSELSPLPLILMLWQQNTSVYLPILHPFCKGHLLFQLYEASTQMTTNKYGIKEPKLNVDEVCPLARLDLIIAPLVAFDSHGNRLGMGGGFYDRTLAASNSPTAIGYAHDCQRIESLPTQSWDEPCQSIVTPSKIYRFC